MFGRGPPHGRLIGDGLVGTDGWALGRCPRGARLLDSRLVRLVRLVRWSGLLRTALLIVCHGWNLGMSRANSRSAGPATTKNARAATTVIAMTITR